MTAEEKAREYAIAERNKRLEIIKRIPVNKANLEYITEHGSINGSLMLDIEIAMEKYALSSLSQYQEVLKELISQIEDWECDHKSSYDGKEQIPTSVFRETVEKAKEML